MLILVVEDDPIIGCAAAAELEDAGHEVLGPALSAEEANVLVARRRPALAFVDINLQKQGEGVELARALRAAGVPSFFVSGQVAEARANQDAAMGLLQKPFNLELLVRSIPVAEAVGAGEEPRNVPAGLELFLGYRRDRTPAAWS